MKRSTLRISWLILVWFVLAATLLPVPSVAQSVDRLFRQGLAAERAERYSEAETIWRHLLELEPGNSSAYYNLGNSLYLQKKFSEAEAAYRSALQLDPDHVYARNNLGSALYIQGKLDDALAAYEQVLAVRDVDGTPVSAHTLAYVGAGDTLRDLGRVEEAIESYQRAIRLNSEFAPAYSGLGIALIQQGDLEAATTALQTALDLPDDVDVALVSIHAIAYTYLGNIAEAQAKLEEAIEFYQEALALAPNFELAKSQLAAAEQSLAQSLEQEDEPEAPVSSPPVSSLPTPLDLPSFGAALRSAMTQIFQP